VLIYFNFEDAVLGGPFDPTSDDVPPIGDNPGGGLQHSTIDTNLTVTGAVAGTLLNRTSGDIDIANPGLSMGMRTTPPDNGHHIQFSFNATAFSNMSLSFAIDTQGNGFNTVTFSYSTTGPGGTFTDFNTASIPSGGGYHIFSSLVPPAVNGQPNVTLRLTFDGGKSRGNDLQTQIDNIQLTGVP
jgi:hypothetical protein